MKKFVSFTNIYLDFPRNYILIGCIIFGLAFSVAIIAVLSVHWVWKVPTLIVISIYSYYIYQRYGICVHPKAWATGRTISANQWLLQNKEGNFFASQLRADTFVSTWMIVLRWNLQLPASKCHIASLLLFKPMFPTEKWRRLCCHLRWQKEKN